MCCDCVCRLTKDCHAEMANNQDNSNDCGRSSQHFPARGYSRRHISLMSGCLLAIAYILACLPYRAEAIGQIRWEYHDYAMLHQELDDFRLRWPQLSRVYTIGTSVKGREMYVLEISDNPGVHEVGKLLIF